MIHDIIIENEVWRYYFTTVGEIFIQKPSDHFRTFALYQNEIDWNYKYYSVSFDYPIKVKKIFNQIVKMRIWL